MSKIKNDLKLALSRAYVPYSNFRVAAVAELNDGTTILGSNIENSSYPVTICAERSCLSSLISQGINPKEVKTLYIYNPDKEISPCGMCRQFMSEVLDRKTEVILTNLKDFELKTSVEELLPFAFSMEK